MAKCKSTDSLFNFLIRNSPQSNAELYRCAVSILRESNTFLVLAVKVVI